MELTPEQKKKINVNFLENFVTMEIPDELIKYSDELKSDFENMIMNHGGKIMDYKQTLNKHTWKIS